MANGRVSCSAEELLRDLKEACKRGDSRQIERCCDELVGMELENPKQVANEMRSAMKRCHDCACRKTIRDHVKQLSGRIDTEPPSRRDQIRRPTHGRRSVRT